MKVEKIAKTAGPERVPRIYWQWVKRMEPEEEAEKETKSTENPETEDGQLVLYNKYGKKVIKDIKKHEYIKG